MNLYLAASGRNKTILEYHYVLFRLNIRHPLVPHVPVNKFLPASLLRNATKERLPDSAGLCVLGEFLLMASRVNI